MRLNLISLFLLAFTAVPAFSFRPERDWDMLSRLQERQQVFTNGGVMYMLSVYKDRKDFVAQIVQKDGKIRVQEEKKDGNIWLSGDGENFQSLKRGQNMFKAVQPLLSTTHYMENMCSFSQETNRNGYKCMLFSCDNKKKVCISQLYGIPVYVNDNGTIINVKNIKKAVGITDNHFIFNIKR